MFDRQLRAPLLPVDEPISQESLTGQTRWSVRLAKTQADVIAAQRLRYQVFAEELGADLAGQEHELDADEFDADCDHLLVFDRHEDLLVGCYRILSPLAASRRGGYYTETEFNLRPLAEIRNGIAEVGRACIHADYRSGGVILMLWSGLARYMTERGYPYVMGCVSLGLADGGLTASAVCQAIDAQGGMPAEFRVVPHRAYPWRNVLEGMSPARPRLPPLVKGYQRLGAWLHAEPAWDPQFNTADLFVLLPLHRMNSTYTRHFLGHGNVAL
jgi:putative hemolysin